MSHLTLFISYLGGEKEGEKDDPKTFDYQEHYDQIGRSLEVLGNKFSTNVAQIFETFWPILKIIFFNQHVVATFWATFSEIWATYFQHLVTVTKNNF